MQCHPIITNRACSMVDNHVQLPILAVVGPIMYLIPPHTTILHVWWFCLRYCLLTAIRFLLQVPVLPASEARHSTGTTSGAVRPVGGARRLLCPMWVDCWISHWMNNSYKYACTSSTASYVLYMCLALTGNVKGSATWCHSISAHITQSLIIYRNVCRSSTC